MVEVAVSLYGHFRDITRESKLQLSLPDQTNLKGLLEALAQRFGDSFRERVFLVAGEPDPAVRVFINGHLAEDWKEVLPRERAEVAVSLLPPMMGGEDTWIPSACSLCYNQCGILVHRVDGVVVKIEGNPKSPQGMGRLCPRGVAGIQVLYDPYRVDYPLKRTNPEKGMGVDPQWQRITWEEALDIITEKLKKLREENPQKLIACGCVPSLMPLNHFLGIWRPAFGSANAFISDGHHCGNAEHILAGALHGSTTTNLDLEHCNYTIIFGCNVGFASYYGFTTMAQRMADARVRGMKLVVVDPGLNAAAEKADEWVPIKPGTDGALACAMLNLLLNEYHIYDAEYLKNHTNAPYLIAPDGLYLRDQETGKPLLWDRVEGRAKAFDDPAQKEPALEGGYSVGGVEVKTAFQLLKEAVAQWSPEAASQITTVSAQTIRRLAREFGEAAQIGKTISLEGRELPYRPVAVIYFKGAHGHNNAWLTSLALELLCEVVGSADVPGGLLGTNPLCLGHPDTGMPHYEPKTDRDGLLVPGLWFGASAPGTTPPPYPPRMPRKPQFYNLMDLLPWPVSSFFPVITIPQRERFQIPYEAEVLINYGSNLLMSLGNPEDTVEAFKNLFVISSNLWLDETAEALSDLVLPDTCYLERLDPIATWYHHHHPVGPGEWVCQIRQPIVPPTHERRHFSEVLMEVARRVGFYPDLNIMTNLFYGLKPPFSLDPQREYTWEQVVDTIYKGWFGPEHGLEWFQREGVLTWPKKLEEAYFKPFFKGRVPIYVEWMVSRGQRVKEIVQEMGLEDMDTSSFLPLPDWKPCIAFHPHPGYDLQAIYYRVAWHTFSMTYENPWLDEVSQLTEPYSYQIALHRQTAREKGIKEGDPIWVESVEGNRVKGRAKLVEGIHPQVVGIANNGGHWARGMPFARGKGVFFNALLPLDLKHTDPVSITLDCDSRVRIYKA